jgi:UPF0716 protein FxsA
MALLVLAFFVIPFLELFVILQASHAIGGWNTIGLLLLISLLGGWLMKHEGRKVWRRFNEQVGRGVVPSNDIADGVLLLGAGALLLTPGFLTDIVGILIMFPPTRAIFRRALVKRFMSKSGLGDLGKTFAGGVFGGGRGAGPFGRTRRGDYVDTTLFEPSTRVDPQRDELDR